MSRLSKATFALATIFTVGTVVAVHVNERAVQERLHEGVLRDLEKQRRRQHNKQMLQEQQALTEKLITQRELLAAQGAPERSS